MLLAIGEDVVIGGREGEGGTGAQSQQRDQGREVRGLDIVVDRVCSRVTQMVLIVDIRIYELVSIVQMRDGHLVLSQGARLIRADAGGAPEGLHGLQVLYEDFLGSHSLGRECHTDSNCDLKALWDVSNEDADAED
jgi:hypothetical protein